MTFTTLLHNDNIQIDTVAKSKASVLLNMSQLLSQCYPELDARTLFNAYWERENLGSTTIGHGIMIPHIRVASIHKTYGCFIRLQHAVDFDAEDKQPIDLVFGLAVAAADANQYLDTLASIVERFDDPTFRSECRRAQNQMSLVRCLTRPRVLT